MVENTRRMLGDGRLEEPTTQPGKPTRRAAWPILGLVGLLAGGLASTPAPALASDQEPAIREVHVRVSDYETKVFRENLLPGQVLELRRGDSVWLRVIEVPAAANRNVRYPKASWKIVSGSRRVNLSHAQPEYGSVVLTAVQPDDPANPDSTTLVQYRILEPVNGPPKMQGGDLTVRVVDTATSQAVTTPAPTDSRTSWADAVTQALYEGILLREPDPSGAQGYIDMLRSRGMGGVEAAARDIAGSAESLQGIYQRQTTYELGGRTLTRTVTPADRLLALYEKLLGKSAEDIPRYDWAQNLDLIQQGKIADVVAKIVSSPDFHERWQMTRYAVPKSP